MKIDLHMHSTASDGELRPSQLIKWAASKKLQAISITDHDTIAGQEEAIKQAKLLGLEYINGIELSCNAGSCEIEDIHIVGLYIDYESKQLNELTNFYKNTRKIEKQEIIKKLQNLGYDINFDELKKEVPNGNYGKPHIANILMRKYPNNFTNMQDIFDKLLGSKGSACVNRQKKSMEETIEIIHNANGIAVLAHPFIYSRDKLDQIINLFHCKGGDAIEINYPYPSYVKIIDSDIEHLKSMAKKYNLATSGGTDFHFKDKGMEIGDYGINREELNQLKKRIK